MKEKKPFINPYRCKVCNKMGNKFGWCKRHEPVCRYCGGKIHWVNGKPTELCEKHFYNDLPELFRKDFSTPINDPVKGEGVIRGKGAIPMRSVFDSRNIKGWGNNA